MLRHTLTGCVVLFLCSASSPAVEWNAFRGPGGDGHAAVRGLPTEWSESRNVVWRQVVPGQGWSSPVVNDDTICVIGH